MMTLLLYMFVSVPILMLLISWRMTGQADAGWQLSRANRDRFILLVAGLAAALPLLLSGVVCSIFNISVYAYNTLDRLHGSGGGENFDILFLLALVASVPAALIGWFGTRAAWRKIKLLFLPQVLTKPKDDWEK